MITATYILVLIKSLLAPKCCDNWQTNDRRLNYPLWDDHNTGDTGQCQPAGTLSRALPLTLQTRGLTPRTDAHVDIIA